MSINRQLLWGDAGSVKRPLIFLLAALIVSSIIAPSFLSSRNLDALLVSSSFLIVLTVGEALVIMTGMIDLGVQSIMASAGMFVAFLTVMLHVPALGAVPLTLVSGIAAGIGVGFLVTKGRIPSFIVTLGVYWGFKGVALLFNGGNYISPNSGVFSFSGIAGNTLGVSNLIWLMGVVIIVGQVLLAATPLGIWLRSIGSNESSAKTVGLNVDLLKILVFAISGLLAALAGIMIAGWQGSIYPSSGRGFSLQAIAAVILGGIPFSGGRGSVVGAAIGALIIGLIDDLIVLMGLPSLYEYIFVAVILIIAGLQARSKGIVK